MESNKVFAFLILFFILSNTQAVFGQTFNSSFSGKIQAFNGDLLSKVTIIAEHKPSGTWYAVFSTEDGQFQIPNMRPGGPYAIKAHLKGYNSAKLDGLFLEKDQNLELTLVLEPLTGFEVAPLAASAPAAAEKTAPKEPESPASGNWKDMFKDNLQIMTTMSRAGVTNLPIPGIYTFGIVF